MSSLTPLFEQDSPSSKIDTTALEILDFIRDYEKTTGYTIGITFYCGNHDDFIRAAMLFCILDTIREVVAEYYRICPTVEYMYKEYYSNPKVLSYCQQLAAELNLYSSNIIQSWEKVQKLFPEFFERKHEFYSICQKAGFWRHWLGSPMEEMLRQIDKASKTYNNEGYKVFNGRYSYRNLRDLRVLIEDFISDNKLKIPQMFKQCYPKKSSCEINNYPDVKFLEFERTDFHNQIESRNRDSYQQLV